MVYDRPDKRGAYTESVLLTMRFLDAPELEIRQDQPQATEEDGSVSNTLSYNVGAGFFGETVTGSAGASISNTITETLPDFEFLNETRDATVTHTERLRFVGGNAYPPDLVEPFQKSMVGALCELPPRATGTCP